MDILGILGAIIALIGLITAIYGSCIVCEIIKVEDLSGRQQGVLLSAVGFVVFIIGIALLSYALT